MHTPFFENLQIQHLRSICFAFLYSFFKKEVAFISRKIIKFCEYWPLAFKFLQNM